MNADVKFSERASAEREALFSSGAVPSAETAHRTLRALRDHGVDIVFGYPGGAIMPLHDALHGHDIRHVLMRHEAGAAFAAGGFARATGRVGVCVATSGPGATNLVTGIADAMLDNVPMIAITGQVKSALMGTDAFQEVDIAAVTQAITKRNIVVRSAADIEGAFAAAFRLARGPRPGPVLIDMPSDVLKSTDCAAPLTGTPTPERPRPVAAHEALVATLDALAAAERPVIIVGGGARWSGATQAFRRFCELTNVPYTCTLHGLGCARSNDPNFLGMVGMHGWTRANRAVSEADVLIALGMRFDDRVTSDPSRFAPRAHTIVHADIDRSEFDKIVRAHVKLHGDLRDTLERLNERITQPLRDFGAWHEYVHSLGSALPSDTSPTGQLSATQVLDTFFGCCADDTIVTTDVGQHQMWAAQRARPRDPHAFISSGGLGSMGFGLPAAIGAQFAHPQRGVVAIVGDGGFQMVLGELATLRRYALPVKILLIDNRNLGMVRQWQELFYDGRYAATSLWDNPDFSLLARAYGIRVWSIDTTSNISGVMREALSSSGPALIHAKCYPDGKVFPMIPSGTAIEDLIDPVAR